MTKDKDVRTQKYRGGNPLRLSAVCRDRFFQEHVYEKSGRSSSRPAATSRTTAELDNENTVVGIVCILKS